MIHDLISASYKGEYIIEVRFDDGKGGGGIFLRIS
jgi:hypothetical protein